MILVSACLLGHNVKYNGGNNANELLQKYNARGRFVAVCPECFAMLPVPRPPMEIQGGSGKKLLAGKTKAVDKNGMDTTAYLLTGARKLLKIAESYHAHVAILKDGSPSCGVHYTYDGTCSGHKTKGSGATTALLQQHGLTVYSEKDITVGRFETLLAEDLRQDRL